MRSPGSTTAEMYRQLSAAVLKAMDASGARTLAVMTAHPGGGSTTVASNLAASLHAAGRSVAVLDANLGIAPLVPAPAFHAATPPTG